MSANKIRAGELYDLLVGHPEGMTKIDVIIETGWSDSQFAGAVQALRDTFCNEGDTITLVAEPQEFQESWLYILIDGAAVPNEDKTRWTGIMLSHVERRCKTMKNVLAAAVKATDGRSTNGRKARIYHHRLTQAEQEIALLGNENGLPD